MTHDLVAVGEDGPPRTNRTMQVFTPNLTLSVLQMVMKLMLHGTCLAETERPMLVLTSSNQS